MHLKKKNCCKKGFLKHFIKNYFQDKNSNKFQKGVSIFLKLVCGLFLGRNIEIWSQGAKLNVLH